MAHRPCGLEEGKDEITVEEVTRLPCLQGLGSDKGLHS